LLLRPYADEVKIKPQIVVLSDSDKDNHDGHDAPCRTVQQDMFRVHSTANDATVGFFNYLVYGFHCNELQRTDEQLGSD